MKLVYRVSCCGTIHLTITRAIKHLGRLPCSDKNHLLHEEFKVNKKRFGGRFTFN